MKNFAFAHPSLKGFDTLDVLQLIRSENVGPVTFFHLVSFYGSPKAALAAIPELAKKGGSKRPIKLCSRSEAEKELAAIHAYGGKVLKLGDADYPPLLQTIHDAPPIIIVKGRLEWLKKQHLIGIVGARNGSANACQFARMVAMQLGKKEVVVVSGLARGIDTAAHHGALVSGTVAVVAGGLDHIYPPENAKLHQEIAEQGVIVSEAPFGSAPMARHFPARNRIIAGMSQGLMVVEASLKSGSLITAEYALDYGREVFSVPGSPVDPRCRGTNSLIKQGATLCESAEDILQSLAHSPLPQLEEPAHKGFGAMPPTLPDEASLPEMRAKLLEKLGPEPVELDELLAQCQMSAGMMMCLMVELELAGRLQRHSGGRISLHYGDEN